MTTANFEGKSTQTSPRFWDKIAEKYSRSPVKDEAAYQHKLRKTREYFTLESHVLEVGCGTGSTAIAHAPHAGHIQATDFSEEMIRIAREKAHGAGVANVDFEAVSVEEIQAASGSLDAVLAMSVLHLLPERDGAIARAYDWLKPGGVFVSSTVCLGDGYSWFRLVGPIGKALGLFPYVNVFKRDDLRAAIKAAGFEIDYDWAPSDKAALFLVAKKPG